MTLRSGFFSLMIIVLLSSCYSNTQDTPEAVVDTFAQSVAAMDIESAAGCFENGNEILSLMMGMSGNDTSVSVIQDYIEAAKESDLLPEISYEILDTKMDEDKGVVRVKFNYRFDDGETVHESSDEHEIPVYLHDGMWYIGEGYSKSEREMAKRGARFLENLSKRRNSIW